jgi:hypothetical protein
MKKISNLEMSKIEGGVKCIYIYMGFVLLAPLSSFLGQSVVECWNGTHNE